MKAGLCSMGAGFILFALGCLLMWPQPQLRAQNIDVPPSIQNVNFAETLTAFSSSASQHFRVPAGFRGTECFRD